MEGTEIMIKVKPFRAVRPANDLAAHVAAHAYDVVSREEARRLVHDNPYSFLRVEKSEINLPDSVDPYSDVVYESARDTLQAMMEGGVMIRDEAPFFYIYQQRMGDHIQNGIVACVDVKDYVEGRIKRHEMTRADKELDRIRHIDRVNAQTGPVFLAYRRNRSIDSIIDRIVEKTDPECRFTADDGTSHSVWIVRDDADMEQIKREFASVDSLYIADGHHRAAAAAGVAERRRKSNQRITGEEGFDGIMAVIFAHDQLQIFPYNRVVKDLAGVTEEAFLDRLSEDFIVEESKSGVSPRQKGSFGLYLPGRWYGMILKDAKDSIPGGRVSSLDVSILQDRVLGPVLKLVDVRSDERIDFVGGTRGISELERLVDSGDFAVAFSLHPVDMESLMAVSDSGQVMPPKSTWFEPKLKSGLFVHFLD